MTAPSSIDPARFLHDQLESASPDLLRSMLTTFINALMSAEADAVCGAPYGMPGVPPALREVAGPGQPTAVPAAKSAALTPDCSKPSSMDVEPGAKQPGKPAPAGGRGCGRRVRGRLRRLPDSRRGSNSRRRV